MRLPVAMLAGATLVACAAGGPEPAPSGGPTPYAGGLAVAPDPVRFGETVVGCVHSVILTLENRSPDRTIVITGANVSDAVATLSGSFPATLKPGERQFVDLYFSPTRAGPWSGEIGFATDEGPGSPYRLAATGEALAAPSQPRDLAAVEPLDLVFVLDVSTSMNEMARLRGAIQELVAFIEAHGLDIRFGLTTFVNDVVVHRGGAFLDREAFFGEFDSQLVSGTWVPDPENPRQLLNFDLPENSLEALQRSATEFAFRPDARRYFVLMTDDTFLEPYGVFSDGTPATVSFDAAAAALQRSDVRLFSIHPRAKGRGLSSNYKGKPSLVSLTGGSAFELADVSSGALTLDKLLADLVVGPACS